MSEEFTEQDAQLMVGALILATLNDDKEAREIIYADLEIPALKRLIRWQARAMVGLMVKIAIGQGYHPVSFIEHWVQANSKSINKENE